jgi:hypothetical protein
MRMLKYYFLAVVIFLPVLLMGQEAPLRLAPYTVSAKFLNQQITEDSIANGIVPNRVYMLQRGGLYLINAIIRNPGWQLSIRSNDSVAGPKPVVMLYPTSTGIPPGQAFDVRADLTLRNILLTGYYELVDSNINNLQGSLMNTGVAGANITIDSCILSNTNGNHIRTDQAPKNIVITNTVFANMGFLGRSNLGAGKGIDVRAGSVDTLVLQNCTFVNWQDRVVRHFTSTAPIKYFKFDHNTLVNGGSYHGMLSLGRLGNKAIITNNVLLDPFAFGNDTDATRQAEFTDSGEKDPFGKARMTWVISNPNDTTQWTVSNNYYGISDSGQAFYNRYASAGVTGEGSPLTWHINSKLGADSVNAFKKIKLSLAKVPNGMNNLMDWYRDPNGGKKTKNTPIATWVRSLHDFDRKGWQYVRDSLNANIKVTATVLTKLASSDGKVVGDPRWGTPSVVADPNALIVVDGNKDAFYGALTGPSDGYIQLKSSAFNDNGAPKSDADLSAKFWAAWDESWFYLYGEIKDDTISGTGANSYQDDGIELKFDAQAKDSVTNSIFAPNLTILGGAGSDSLNLIPNAQKQYSRKLIDGGYAVEMAINWPAIGTTEKVSVGVDSVFGLAINVHDNDGNLSIGGGRQASVMWAAVMLDHVWDTPKYLGTIKFKSGNKLAFIAKNNMTGRANTLKYDGSDPSLSVKVGQNAIPTEFALEQNYPNPFNPTTSIKFQLPASANVTLKVYDAIGREVSSLVNGVQEVGYYTVKFDASKLSSGLYFYQLRAGNYVETKKMMLLK